MPSLRIGGRAMRTSNVVPPALPTELALDQSLRVGVFDGGLGPSDLGAWVTETVMPGTETTSSAYLNHGIGVTSRSEEHTSELHSLMRISYASFCLTQKKTPLPA